MDSFSTPQGITNDKQLPMENVIQKADPLILDIDPKALVEVMDKRVEDSKTWFNKYYDYDKKTKLNKDYMMGRQWDPKDKYKAYNAPYMDNLIYEGEATIKPIVMNKLPDLFIKPGNNTPQAKQDADDLSKIFMDEERSREERQVLGLSFKHIPVWYIGAIKPTWDPERGPFGDYEFVVIPPNLLILDSMANSLDVRKHQMIGNYWPLTVKEVIMRFPKAKKDLLRELGIDVKGPNAQVEKQMATTIKIMELHFTWYEQEEDKWKRIDGVLWKYKKVFLDGMKDPNWDWEGDERLYQYDLSKMEKQKTKDVDLQDVLLHSNPQAQPGIPMMAGPMQFSQGMVKEKEFHNHFEEPRKPYILVGYDQWGETVIDETSRIEQVIPLQDNVNIRGRQITDTANRSRGKDIFSTSTGLKKKDIENLDMSDPDTDLLVKGNPKDVHEHIEGDQPKPSLFQDQAINRDRVFSKLGTHDSTRGKRQAKGMQHEQSLIQQDFGRLDDLTNDTINAAAEQMAEWKLQFIKLRYTVDHFKSILGSRGETVFYRVNRDMIHDHMSVITRASSVDKMLRKQEAYQKLKLKATDILSFYEEIDEPDPKGKAEQWYLFTSNPAMWYEKYVKGNQTLQQVAGQLPGAPGSAPSSPINSPTPQVGGGQAGGVPPGGGVGQAPPSGGSQQAQQDIQSLIQGQPVTPPPNLDAQYIQTIEQFIQSGEFQSLPPEAQQNVTQFAQQIVQISKQMQGAGVI